MQLVSLPVSPFAARVRIAIHAKALPVAIVPPPAGWPASRAYRDLNPIGRVPVLLLEDGSCIAESAVILEYLEEAFPDSPRLLPDEPLARARERVLVRMADSYLMPPMIALARPGLSEAEGRRHAEALVDAFAALEVLLQHREPPHQPGFADCALAPTLFAADVTGRRLGLELTGGSPTLTAYRAALGRIGPVALVLAEMGEGLRRLERA